MTAATAREPTPGALPRPPAARRQRELAPWIALAPGLLFFLTFFLAPAARLLQISLAEFSPGVPLGAGFTFGNYVAFLTSPFYLAKLGLTVKICLEVAVATLVLAYPVAYLIVRGRFAGKGLVIGLLLSPLLTNFVVLIFAWIVLLGDSGFLARGISALMGHATKLLYAEAGVVVSLIHVSLPYAIVPLIASIAQVGDDIEEAALSLGAGPWRTLFLVVLPMTMPGLLAALFVVVSVVLSGFSFALYVGGDSTLIVPLLIWQSVNATLNWPLAAAMSFIAFFMVLAATAVAVLLTRGPMARAPS